MYEKQDSVFYYVTVGNENYPMPSMPEGVKEGIIKGLYRFKKSSLDNKLKAHLFGSGAIMNQVLKAQEILEKQYHVASDVWSVTSYNELRRDALTTERWNLLHPDEKPKQSYLQQCFAKEDGVFVAASDYMKTLPDSIAKWLPRPLMTLGTDGFGRSESRQALRDFFEIDDRFIVLATLTALERDGKIKKDVVQKAIKDLKIDPEKLNPMIS